jgi:iron complex transport system substrate-binding protein
MSIRYGGPTRYRAILALTIIALVAGCAATRQRPTSSAPPSSAGFPVTLKDAQGVEVRAERPPRRIVSLAPTVTEILYAIGAGDRVVAAADPADYPPAAAKLPRVGGWFTPSAEKTLGAEPDLVIGSRGNPPDLVATLRKSGCQVFTIDPATLHDILAAIQQIGEITGASQGASQASARLEARLAAVAARVGEVAEAKRPTAFILISVNPVWTAGAETFQDDAIRAAGARNIAARLKGFRPFSTESLLAADPDFLLLSTREGDPERMRRDVLSDPVLKRLSAVRRNHLVVLEANHIMRPGPRIVDAIEAMARAFYPDRFSSAPKPNSSATSAR